MPQHRETETIWAKKENGNVVVVECGCGRFTSWFAGCPSPGRRDGAQCIVADRVADRIVAAATPSAQLPCC